jgi:hypothetical protein
MAFKLRKTYSVVLLLQRHYFIGEELYLAPTKLYYELHFTTTSRCRNNSWDGLYPAYSKDKELYYRYFSGFSDRNFECYRWFFIKAAVKYCHLRSAIFRDQTSGNGAYDQACR